MISSTLGIASTGSLLMFKLRFFFSSNYILVLLALAFFFCEPPAGFCYFWVSVSRSRCMFSILRIMSAMRRCYAAPPGVAMPESSSPQSFAPGTLGSFLKRLSVLSWSARAPSWASVPGGL